MIIYIVVACLYNESNNEWVGTDKEKAYSFKVSDFSYCNKIIIETWRNNEKIKEDEIK